MPASKTKIGMQFLHAFSVPMCFHTVSVPMYFHAVFVPTHFSKSQSPNLGLVADLLAACGFRAHVFWGSRLGFSSSGRLDLDSLKWKREGHLAKMYVGKDHHNGVPASIHSFSAYGYEKLSLRLHPPFQPILNGSAY